MAAPAALPTTVAGSELAPEGDTEAVTEEGSETGEVGVGTGVVPLWVVPLVRVEALPVIVFPVTGGELSVAEEDVGVDVPEADPEDDPEPPRIEVIANAGLAFPESPIKTMI